MSGSQNAGGRGEGRDRLPLKLALSGHANTGFVVLSVVC